MYGREVGGVGESHTVCAEQASAHILYVVRYIKCANTLFFIRRSHAPASLVSRLLVNTQTSLCCLKDVGGFTREGNEWDLSS